MSKEHADELEALEMDIRASMDKWLAALRNEDDQRHEFWAEAHAKAENLNARKESLDPAP
jgi:hypothetical protein